jgi:hypothetical protein
MFYDAKVAVCSEIRTKHINAMWAPRRIVECQTWWYVKLLLGFRRLRHYDNERLHDFYMTSKYVACDIRYLKK